MPYELEFLPVGEGSRSGDAITMRYHDGAAWRVVVIDGGYQVTGETIVQHVRRWYQTEVIDHMVCTHPDDDHISGLLVVADQMVVRNLWTCVPHAHAANIINLFQSGRWQVENLRTHLRRQYPKIGELADLVRAKGGTCSYPFQGAQIGPFIVLSPSQRFYEGLLPQFRDTPTQDIDFLASLGHLISGVGRRVSSAIRYTLGETWFREQLREGGMTSAENESSVVLYANLGDGGILLTSDAGLLGLKEAADFADARGLALRDGLRLFQVPHHGSRNNISPSMLNRLVGPVVAEGTQHRSWCVISAGREDATHPRQIVVNALLRRGLKPLVTRGKTIRCMHDVPARDGWTTAQTLPFSTTVEEYD